jgi:hypothetical protein
MKRFQKPTAVQLVLILAGLLAAIYITDLLVQRSKTIVLQLFVANDDNNVFEAKTMEAELASLFSIRSDERIIIDDSLYVVLGSSDHYVESSLSKIYAYMAAKELDALIAPMTVVEHYANGLPMLDYPTLLSNRPDLLERLAPYLQAAGLEKEYLLDLSQSRYKPSESMYMIIPESAPRLQALIRFLEYLFPLY